MAMRHTVLLLPLVLCFLSDAGVAASLTRTNVASLPGFGGALPSRLETGCVRPYVTVDEENGAELFYYFIESEGDPGSDPVLLWITGGDRCSILSALFFEIGEQPATRFTGETFRILTICIPSGPLKLVVEPYSGNLPRLRYHPYTWTKVANLLFVDSPIGAGFSFSRNPRGYDVGDVSASLQLVKFLSERWKGSSDLEWEREIEVRFNAKLDLLPEKMDAQLKRMDEEAQQWKEVWKNSPLKRFVVPNMEETSVEKKGGDVANVAPEMPRQYTVASASSIVVEDAPPTLVVADLTTALIGCEFYTTADSDDVKVHDGATAETASLSCEQIRVAWPYHDGQPYRAARPPWHVLQSPPRGREPYQISAAVVRPSRRRHARQPLPRKRRDPPRWLRPSRGRYHPLQNQASKPNPRCSQLDLHRLSRSCPPRDGLHASSSVTPTSARAAPDIRTIPPRRSPAQRRAGRALCSACPFAVPCVVGATLRDSRHASAARAREPAPLYSRRTSAGRRPSSPLEHCSRPQPQPPPHQLVAASSERASCHGEPCTVRSGRAKHGVAEGSQGAHESRGQSHPGQSHQLETSAEEASENKKAEYFEKEAHEGNCVLVFDILFGKGGEVFIADFVHGYDGLLCGWNCQSDC
ncbi:hypothetical protein GUJ93_ZPchr0011g27533 [Zizania palustris]|uniref:Uncharacterized protein n=1 Tax=Zizania palustris TaxID=103762 RepID=A0A8J5WJV7_ZIZPA|nr:hypothetical protein GUJ93_ZPchr0011g27533 [Zizania palustris]